MKSKKTKVVSYRLDVKDYDAVFIRAYKKGMTVGQYLKYFIERDLHRNKSKELVTNC